MERDLEQEIGELTIRVLLAEDQIAELRALAKQIVHWAVAQLMDLATKTMAQIAAGSTPIVGALVGMGLGALNIFLNNLTSSAPVVY